MSYRDPDVGDMLSKLHKLEFDNLSLQEENRRLKILLVTETTRSIVKLKKEPPELLNAAMLEEYNPVRRFYQKIKCSVFGTHRWICMADLNQLFQQWKEFKAESSAPFAYFIKVQCRDCKMVGKEFRESQYRGRTLAETAGIMNAMSKTEQEILNYFQELEDEG